MKHFRLVLITLMIAAVLCSCADQESYLRSTQGDARYMMQSMVFVKHPNGLCFAVLYPRSNAMSMTNIPCTSGDTTFVR